VLVVVKSRKVLPTTSYGTCSDRVLAECLVGNKKLLN